MSQLKGSLFHLHLLLTGRERKKQELKMSKYPPVVMTSRPDVMQLLWFFSTEKHRLTIKVGEGGGAKTGTDSVCLGVCRSFPFSQQAAACVENKSATSSSQLMSER